MRVALILAALAVAAPAWAQQTPITASRFGISIDGVEFASFTELKGISSSVDDVTLQRSGPRAARFSVDGLVSLGRPLSTSLELAKWHEEAIANGLRIRKDMVLVVYGVSGDPVARYQLTDAWPAKIEVGALKAGSSEVLMETITIACERIQRVSP